MIAIMKRYIRKIISTFLGKIRNKNNVIDFKGKYVLHDFDYGSLLLNTHVSMQRNLIIQRRSHEPELQSLFKKIMKQGQYVIDVGANVGLHSVLFSKLVGNDGHVFCVEPVRETAEQLRINLLLNGCNNTTVFDCGLGSSVDEKAIFVLPEKNIGGSTILANEKVLKKRRLGETVESRKVEINTLDEMTNKINKRINFLKIDVEGYELAVLRGGVKLIGEQLPLIVMEYDSSRMELLGIDNREFNVLLSDQYNAYEVIYLDDTLFLEPYYFDRRIEKRRKQTSNVLLLPKHHV